MIRVDVYVFLQEPYGLYEVMFAYYKLMLPEIEV